MENNNYQVYNTQKTNGLCVAGFVVSLVSLILCGGSISLISLILSIIGVSGASKRCENGKGLGIAGIIISAVSMFIAAMILLIMIVTGGISALTLSEALAQYDEASHYANTYIEEDENDEDDEDDEGIYTKDFGTYHVDTSWEEVDSGASYYVYCEEGTFTGDTSDIPDNIMVSHDTNPYGEDEFIEFKNAILLQLNDQMTQYPDVNIVEGAGISSDNGYTVLKFDMRGDESDKVQYYICGDHEYVCVSVMIWDTDASDGDILDVAEDIVNSFEWAD